MPGHLNKYEDTWLYLLKRGNPDCDFISYFKRQLTSEVLNTSGGGIDGVDEWPKGADFLEAYMPDVVIIQLGIVDCAPRLLNQVDRIVIRLMPLRLQKIYISFIKKIRKRNPNKTFVPYKRFKQIWDNYLERAKRLKTRVIIVSISIPDHRMVVKNERILESIELYNSYYYELSKKYHFVDMTEPLKESDVKVYEDGYHPNTLGQKIIFERIHNLLSCKNITTN